MKKYIYICLTAAIIAGCKQDPSSPRSIQRIRKQAVEVAEKYAREKLKDPAKSETKNGLITYSSGDTKCVVDPSFVVIGEIDEDSLKDAIVTIFTMVGQRMPLKEHLILLNKNGKLSVSREMNGDMKFLSISDRTIYIEISHAASDSPFGECQLCKEIRRYKYEAGDTVRIK